MLEKSAESANSDSSKVRNSGYSATMPRRTNTGTNSRYAYCVSLRFSIHRITLTSAPERLDSRPVSVLIRLPPSVV
ncbi:hypothetical protein C8039_04805 [Halogeometricum sp. wsp3]|nr:hypothetical protein C8039_04805 [Halogeometricum sp. wsp3]